MYEIKQENSLEQLKRVDHLIYVSLKYTRTCDVMKNVIKRLISSYDLATEEILEYAKNNNKIREIPISRNGKIKKVQELLGKHGNKYFKLYELLKKIDKADYYKYEEFRKNVTLITKTKPEIKVKTETLHSYFEKTKEFIFLAQGYMKND